MGGCYWEGVLYLDVCYLPMQLNTDGTQLLELIRPNDGQLGVQLTQGNKETLQGQLKITLLFTHPSLSLYLFLSLLYLVSFSDPT